MHVPLRDFLVALLTPAALVAQAPSIPSQTWQNECDRVADPTDHAKTVKTAAVVGVTVGQGPPFDKPYLVCVSKSNVAERDAAFQRLAIYVQNTTTERLKVATDSVSALRSDILRILAEGISSTLQGPQFAALREQTIKAVSEQIGERITKLETDLAALAQKVDGP